MGTLEAFEGIVEILGLRECKVLGSRVARYREQGADFGVEVVE